jgi:hypothetical protein
MSDYFYIVPLYPACKAGLAGHAPVKLYANPKLQAPNPQTSDDLSTRNLWIFQIPVIENYLGLGA